MKEYDDWCKKSIIRCAFQQFYYQLRQVMPFYVVTDITLPFEKYDVMVYAFRQSVMKFVLIKKVKKTDGKMCF